VENIKTIKGRNWHPEEKYWSFPSSDGTPGKILEVLEGEKVYVGTSLKPQLNRYIIAKGNVPKQPHVENYHFELLSESHFGGASDPISNMKCQNIFDGGNRWRLKR
jgi:hypothetical protein